MSHKNDPDYHDTRAKILLEAAQHLSQLAKEKDNTIGGRLADWEARGYRESAVELRRLASEARREHGRVLDKKRRAGRKANPELMEV
jgi:hypothetical protein